MSAEKARDPKHKIETAPIADEIGNGTYTVILDREGSWVDIPCAHDASMLKKVIKDYFKPNLKSEMARLELRKVISQRPNSELINVVDIGIFWYEAPNEEMLEAENWKTALANHMIAAGLDAQPIPDHLLPSIAPKRDNFFGEWNDPDDYWTVSSLQTCTLVLCPAFSQYKPELASGECRAIGYRAAIGVDGNAILELLRETAETETEKEATSYTMTSIKNALKRLIAQD